MEPHHIMKVLSWRLAEEDKLTEAYLCCDCGLCENYSCPMGLSPRRIIQALKLKLIEHKVPNPHRNQPSSTRALFNAKRVPTSRLISRLGLSKYDVPAPLRDVEFQPEEVILPLKQHTGAPARPVVKVGDRVKRGDVVGEIPDGALGARVHSSIDGIVSVVKADEIRIRKE